MLLQANDYCVLHRARGLRAPGRRLRPVGQHHRRHRPHPPAAAAPRSTASPRRCWCAADGPKFGKSVDGARLARPGRDVARTSSSSTSCRSTTPTSSTMLLRLTLVPVDEIDGGRGRARRPTRRAGSASGAWPARSPRSSTDARSLRPIEEASALLFGGDPLAAGPDAFELLADEVPTSPWSAEADARPTWSACSPRPAWRSRRARSGGNRAGYYVNGVAIGGARGRSTASDLLHGRYALLRAGTTRSPPRADLGLTRPRGQAT